MVAVAHRRAFALVAISTSLLILITGAALLWPHHEHAASLPRLTSYDHRRMHSSEGHKEGLEGGTEHADSHGEQVHHEHHESLEEEQGEHADAQVQHGGHAEHEEHKVSPIAFTVAVLIAAFLFADVGLLYLINWRDENVRSSIYKMLSATMSIFLAVTLNAALFSFILEQVLGGGFDEGTIGFRLDVHAIVVWIFTREFFVGLGIFLAGFVSINLLCACMRKSKYLYPIRIIGGHITAFAGITVFGTCQIEAGNSEKGKNHHYAVVIIAALTLITLRVLSKKWRNYKENGQVRLEQNANNANPAAPQTVHEDDEWRVQVCEAEDDATCLILSFLICQVSIWKITGQLEPLHGHGPEKLHPICHVHKMLGFCGIASVFLGVTNRIQDSGCMSCVKEFFSSGCGYFSKTDPDDPTQGYLRIMSNLQTISAMSMSWSALVAGYWAMQIWLHDTYLDSPEMVKVANAGAITILVIGLMIALDKLADQFQSGAARKVHTSEASLDPALEVHKHVERIIRNLIEAYGLLVGLCWEKATDAAIEVIVEGNELFASHRVISKCAFASLMMVFMFRAWYKYIVPSAQKSTKLHKADMMLEDWYVVELKEQEKFAHIIVSRMKSQLDKNDKLASLVVEELGMYMARGGKMRERLKTEEESQRRPLIGLE